MKNHSAFLMSAEGCISPAFTDFSPDEIIAPAAQDRSAARRTVGQRFGPLLYGLAAFFVVAGPVLGASQTDLQPALAQFSQQGSKLVGTGAVGPAEQGWSVALSADGNTAIVGGLADNRITGAAWVFTRSGGVWTQQGSKLVGTGAVGSAGQGCSVALSADGNTAIVGGPFDNSNAGAAWVFTRSGGVWTQQGNKLVGTGAVGSARQGASVALSADGNTAIVGGPCDNCEHRGGVGLHPQRRCLDPAGQQAGRHRRGWQPPDKAPPSRCPPTATPPSWAGLPTTRTPGRRGSSPAAAVSGPSRATSWSAPARLEAPDKAPPSRCPPTATPPSWAGLATTRTPGRRGSSPAAAVSGPSRAASWSAPARLETPDKATPSRCPPTATPPSWAASETTRTSGRRGSTPAAAAVWTQQGNKLVGTGAVGSARQGHSVALSADGNTAIVGGLADARRCQSRISPNMTSRGLRP